ncbi:hypothetical protein GQ43DRAFT_472786 [Delitschia confertaspora ATCC 74209]|uniref:Uncharacterized protein n=1 Tax=Delitschia confertaspora ATCC 74209 TaxID=1513339 RepID=A0A9P4JLG7_9PLEO|nr:hypothetical protein GQ43DRAFT_472786 [Delitschia confertaspora ATCC 74209]
MPSVSSLPPARVFLRGASNIKSASNAAKPINLRQLTSTTPPTRATKSSTISPTQSQAITDRVAASATSGTAA